MIFAPNRKWSNALMLLVATFSSSNSWADNFGPLPISLKGIPVPEVPGLLDGGDPIVVDKEAAIILGKALFWDTNVGSDGMACASCHFHAGADSRVKNQLSPEGKIAGSSEKLFDRTLSNAEGGPNYTLKKSDFPFHLLEDPLDPYSRLLFSSDDVVSSSGTFSGSFSGATQKGDGNDQCERSVDPIYHVGAVGTRRVEARNAPTVINSVFNYRNFWDGRANNIFNGTSPWGDRDPDAGVWVKIDSRNVVKQRLRLVNSSLASLAVAPPLSDTEMACRARSFKDLGRKLIMRRPLEHQRVHHQDGVLGALSFSSEGNLQPGLNTTYGVLIRQAFNPKYWATSHRNGFGKPQSGLAYNQIEANFSMFFALAIQLYESTLISDDSPFDRSARNEEGLPIELSESELSGLKGFRESFCAMCHIGPAFTAAAVATNAKVVKTNPEAFGNSALVIRTSENVVTRVLSNSGSTLSDVGFTSTGVTNNSMDMGLGGVDEFGNPLSFSKQYLEYLAGNLNVVKDESVLQVKPCNFQVALALNVASASPRTFTQVDGIIPQAQDTEGCHVPSWAYQPTPEAASAELDNPDTRKMLAVVDGAFKIPSLRNIELTGPYMHNGSMATLEEVMEFYTRGGNFDTPGKHFGLVFNQADLQFNPQNRADIVAFMKTLTDDRVRYERAPFDHPEIKIPHGHVGDELFVMGGHQMSGDLARDEFIVIDAVGSGGRDEPIAPFVELLLD